MATNRLWQVRFPGLATCLLLLACGSTPQADDAGARDVHEVRADQRGDSIAQDLPFDVAKDAEGDANKDLAATDGPLDDTSQPLEPYRLASVPVPKDHDVYVVHRDFYGDGAMFSDPTQSRLHALPFTVYLLPDGKTLRLGVAWFNGYGAVVKMSMPKPLGREPLLCQDVVDGLLPSGLVYYDIDTESDTAEFVGEVVLTPYSAEVMRWHWSLAIELFGDLSQTVEASACTSTADAFGMCAQVNGKEYLFPMCRHISEAEANDWVDPAGCLEYPLLCGRGCNERASNSEQTDSYETGFVDPTQKALHSLMVRELVSGTEKTLPLSVDGSQIGREQALRSACVEGANADGQPTYLCGEDRPYYFLARNFDEDLLLDACALGQKKAGYASLEDYLSTPPDYGQMGDEPLPRLDSTYYDPFFCADGAFISASAGFLSVWSAQEEGVDLEWAQVFSTGAQWGGWSARGDWHFSGGTSTPYLPLSGGDVLTIAADGSVQMGGHCFYWSTSLLEGSVGRSSFSTATVEGERVFRFKTLMQSSLSIPEINQYYGFDRGSPERPTCLYTTYKSVPLNEYPY